MHKFLRKGKSSTFIFSDVTQQEIGLAALENGHINKDTEDSIKAWLIVALFKFRFDRQAT